MTEHQDTREELLVRLFSLMEKSDNMLSLPPERVESIKEKFRNSSAEQVKAGILMMEKDIEKQLKPQEDLKKNSEKLRRLKMLDAQERKVTAKLADHLLAGLETRGEKTKKPYWNYLLPFLLLIAAAVLWYYILRQA